MQTRFIGKIFNMSYGGEVKDENNTSDMATIDRRLQSYICNVRKQCNISLVEMGSRQDGWLVNVNKAHGGGRVVSASDSETSVSSSTPTSAIIYDAYNSIIKKKKKIVTDN